VQHCRWHRAGNVVVNGEEGVELLRRDLSAEPAEAGEEDQLELRGHRTAHTQEEVVEAALVEMVLDPGAADPANPAVDDDELAMVDAPQPVQVPAARAAGRERPRRRPQLRRAHDADVDARGEEPVVELAARPVRIRAPMAHHHPDGDALGHLGEQRAGERLPDRARPEPELADVDR